MIKSNKFHNNFSLFQLSQICNAHLSYQLSIFLCQVFTLEQTETKLLIFNMNILKIIIFLATIKFVSIHQDSEKSSSNLFFSSFSEAINYLFSC